MCKKGEFKRVLKGGEIKCPQNQTILVVEAVLELVLEEKISSKRKSTKR